MNSTGGGVQPIHLFLAIILSSSSILALLWRLMRTAATTEMKVGMMWEDFKKRKDIKADNG